MPKDGDRFIPAQEVRILPFLRFLLGHPLLNTQERTTLALIVISCGKRDHVWTSDARLAQEQWLTPRTIRRAIKKLKKERFIDRENRNGTTARTFPLWRTEYTLWQHDQAPYSHNEGP